MKKNVLIGIGVLFILLGILLNEWLLASIFSQDGALKSISLRVRIGSFEILLILIGLFMIRYRHVRSVALKNILLMSTGIFFIMCGILLNEWAIARAWGLYSTSAKVSVWVYDIILILTGCFLISLARKISRLSVFQQHILAVLSILLLGFPLLFYYRIKYSLPVGYGGLYVLMAESIASNGFHLPLEIPYYGPGGVPFAYPPLSFFIMAFFLHVFELSSITYMQYAPPVFLLMSLIAMFFLSKEITSSIITAVIATVFFITSPQILIYHYGTDGICRGFALFNMLTGLFFVHKSLQESKALNILAASLFLSFTMLSHPSYAVFFIVSMGAFALLNRHHIKPLILIGIGGLLITMPWWLKIINNHGIEVFRYAFDTHDSKGFSYFISRPRPWARAVHLINFVFIEKQSTIIAGSAILGLAVELSRGRLKLPLWLCLIIIFTGYEGSRFVSIISAILGSSAIKILYESISPQKIGRKYSTIVFTIIILGFAYKDPGFTDALKTPPSISEDIFELSNWFQKNTLSSAKFLLISDNTSAQEMFPYFLKREPLICPFGAEWKGDFHRQSRLLTTMKTCIQKQSYSCLESFFTEHHLAPDFMIIPVDLDKHSIYTSWERFSTWKKVYLTSNYAVWEIPN